MGLLIILYSECSQYLVKVQDFFPISSFLKLFLLCIVSYRNQQAPFIHLIETQIVEQH